ncbi:NAD(P)-binding protein [Annulohypoxylon maeteangense]|uniref:NAD(P)-binding protein n=1 Tax=Annulohypoxylon maeteangense TaxID=1927788 RepID=UPI002007366B|nr:NAD(P)-binding protein [Annulohypoxylon maeteangense]KAI0886652.1 NAD(P)-binding protein [Annulohypoxylon maeteangense]
MSSPVWFITGASNGFGLILSLKALKAGHRVVSSVRNKTKSADAVKQIEDAGGQVIELDMTESKASIDKKIKAVGQIDYLINNAGFFVLGAVEQATEQEAQAQLQTNFFGPLYVLQAALPGMRARRSGTIVNLSSIACKDPQPTSGLYAASKGALEAMSESLAGEVSPFNISVLIVEPGAFRTNFLSAYQAPSAALPSGYEGTTVDKMRAHYSGSSGKQIGDPGKGVDRIYEAVTGEGLAGKLKGKVLRLVIGRDSWERMRRNNDRFLADLAVQEDVALSTDF